MSWTSAIRLLLLIALLSPHPACSDPVPPAPSSTPWRALLVDEPDGLLLSVWGRSADDVYVVGGRPGSTTILHGDRRGLYPVDNPGVSLAWWVCGVGEAVVVVGADGMVLMDVGLGFESLPAALTGTLYGCWGESADDLWVVGGDPVQGPPQLAHLGPEGWRAPVLGVPDHELPPVFYKLWGVGEGLVAVGSGGAVLSTENRVDGPWQLESLAAGEPLFTTISRGEQELWAVGGTGAALAMRRRSGVWESLSPDGLPGLFGVWTAADQPVLVAGQRGTLASFSGSGWQLHDPLTVDTLHAVWGDNEGGRWAVGGNVSEQDPERWHGTVLLR